MELPARFKNLVGEHKTSLETFLEDNPDLLKELSPTSVEAYKKICASVSHWRSKKARSFFLDRFHDVRAIEAHPLKDLMLESAVSLSSAHWALVQHYFRAVTALPHEAERIDRWIELTHKLYVLDVDVAVTFTKETPKALEAFSPEEIFLWGEMAATAISAGRRMCQATRTFLEKSVISHQEGSILLSRWPFFLEQATRISQFSPEGAEAFIREGVRMCLVLDEADTCKWIDRGLEGCSLQPYVENRNFRRKVTPDQMICEGEEELISYFSGISARGMDRRDDLVGGVMLKERVNTLALLCEAVLGKRIKITSNQSLYSVKGFTGGAATDGRTIYLPDAASSFKFYKLLALHQAILLNHEIWKNTTLRKKIRTQALHLEADQRILETMPGLLGEMAQHADMDLPENYPMVDKDVPLPTMPWWGDILPELIWETESVIQKLIDASAFQVDLKPEVVDGLVSSMMAEGNREKDALYRLLREMFDQVDFLSPDAEELEESVKTFFYKEWDQNIADYKQDWCLIRQRFAKDDPNDFVEDIRNRLHGIIGLIRRQFMRLKPERFKKFRAQPYGDALDIDALVQALLDKRSGAFLSDNVYTRRDKRTRDVGVIFLLDMSRSTEDRIHGRRVIDIQKEAMALMAEALDALDDPYAIYGFSSEGRFRVDMFSVKEFGEPYSTAVQYRLGNLEPLELTRMGAVIRHATYKMEAIPSAVKLMVILTDGRPYDFEYGNLNYAIMDTKKAIQEARQKRIHPFIITSDKKGADYLKQIAPQTQSIILSKVELLPTMLPAIYKRLTV
jgi:uncharacterized protein YegL